jgi:hypothetical protein
MTTVTNPQGTSMSVTEKSKSPEVVAKSPGDSLIVVDLDRRYSKKQIKKLRQGRGKLMDRVAEMLAEMAAANTIPATAQPVVVVVREKSELGGWDLLG